VDNLSDYMSEIIKLNEGYNNIVFGEEYIDDDICEDIEQSDDAFEKIIIDLDDLVFRLKSHYENSEGDYAFGVESGMSLAAGMIETIIERHKRGRE